MLASSTHLLSCSSGRRQGPVANHDEIVKGLREFMFTARIPVDDREPRGILPDLSRPGEIMQGGPDILCAIDGLSVPPTMFDVSVVNPCTPSAMETNRPGGYKPAMSLARRSRRKQTTYQEPCRVAGYSFEPLSLTTSGVLDGKVKEVLRVISNRVEGNLPPLNAPFTTPSFYSYARETLSLIITNGAMSHAVRGAQRIRGGTPMRTHLNPFRNDDVTSRLGGQQASGHSSQGGTTPQEFLGPLGDAAEERMDSLHAQRPISLDTSHITPRQDTLRPSTALRLPPLRDSVRTSRPLGEDQVLIRRGPPGVVSLTQGLQQQTPVVDLVRCPEPVYPRGIYATHVVPRSRLEPCLVCVDQGCPNDGCSETNCPAAMWTTTVCGHGFHLQCLCIAIRNQPEPLCPYCRRNLSVPGRVHGFGLLERRVQASMIAGVPSAPFSWDEYQDCGFIPIRNVLPGAVCAICLCPSRYDLADDPSRTGQEIAVGCGHVLHLSCLRDYVREAVEAINVYDSPHYTNTGRRAHMPLPCPQCRTDFRGTLMGAISRISASPPPIPEVQDPGRCLVPELPGGVLVSYDRARTTEPCSICISVGCPAEGCSGSCPAVRWAVTICGHEFHLGCLAGAIQARVRPSPPDLGNPRCPICRHDLLLMVAQGGDVT